MPPEQIGHETFTRLQAMLPQQALELRLQDVEIELCKRAILMDGFAAAAPQEPPVAEATVVCDPPLLRSLALALCWSRSVLRVYERSLPSHRW